MSLADLLNTYVANFLVVGSLLVALATLASYFSQHSARFDQELPGLSPGQYHWLVWPAFAANALFTWLFGPRGRSVRDLFTWRSVTVTLGLSVGANLVCLYFILTSVPADLPPLEPVVLSTLTFSHFVFVLFNFLGDLVSISFSRHIVHAITQRRCNFFRYIRFEFLGIALGYLVTFSPTLLVVGYCLASGSPLNEWISSGLLGNVLIPFFLGIFATTNMPWAFSLFALLAILSVTIPTALYLTTIAVSYGAYRVVRLLSSGQRLRAVGLVQVTRQLGKLLLFLAGLLVPLVILLELGRQ